MDLRLPSARSPVVGEFRVPASKSILQRALVLSALADAPPRLETAGAPSSGSDVTDLERALAALGRWQDGALGRGRRSFTLDLGLGATGFRLVAALAALRPSGARTLVRGRPPLLARPHSDLRRALRRLGGHVVRKPSGALRVIAGGLRGGPLAVGCRRSSQHVSALLLIGPRLGGLDLTLVDRPVSRPYLEVTARTMAAFGLEVHLAGLEGPGGRARVAAGAPACEVVRIEPDASAAAFWWAVAAATGGRASVAGLAPDSPQADVRLLEVLARMGAGVGRTAQGAALVEGPTGGLVAPGVLDLADAPDLLPLVAALAAGARGRTTIVGVAHARGKESDRIATTTGLLAAAGIQVNATPDGLTLEGGTPRPALLHAYGDHRLAFAAALLGLQAPGFLLRGAQSVAKSHPTLWADLEAALGAGRAR